MNGGKANCRVHTNKVNFERALQMHSSAQELMYASVALESTPVNKFALRRFA